VRQDESGPHHVAEANDLQRRPDDPERDCAARWRESRAHRLCQSFSGPVGSATCSPVAGGQSVRVFAEFPEALDVWGMTHKRTGLRALRRAAVGVAVVVFCAHHVRGVRGDTMGIGGRYTGRAGWR
jgi:hypothetical protein